MTRPETVYLKTLGPTLLTLIRLTYLVPFPSSVVVAVYVHVVVCAEFVKVNTQTISIYEPKDVTTRKFLNYRTRIKTYCIPTDSVSIL